MGFYRYIDYAIKCLIRRIIYSKWFWRISFLIIMFFTTTFLCNKIVYGAEVPSGYQAIAPSIVYNLGIYENGLFTEGDDTLITYYFPCYKDVPFGFEFNFNPSINIMIMGYSREVPSVGVQAYSIDISNNLGNYYYSNDGALIDGYFYVICTPRTNVNDYAFWQYESVYDAVKQQTTTIVKNQNENTDKIVESQEQINESLTSTDYDDSVVNIDTSATDDIDDSSSTGLFTTVFNNLSNLISSSNWSSVDTIDIGLPYVDSKIQIRSDILSNMVGNSLLATLINVAWYSLFGLYVFRFSTNIFHAIKSGDILNGLNLNNEVISSTML